MRNADYSAESAAKAADHMKQTWKAEGQDLVDGVVDGPFGITRKVAQAEGLGDSFDQATDVFGTRVVPPQQRSGGEG